MVDETIEQKMNTGKGSAGEAVGYCQDCGRPLTPESARTVGRATFCEPCLGARLGPGMAAAAGTGAGAGAGSAAGAGWTTGTQTGAGFGTGAGPGNMAGSPASPGVAALLGTIPGVGAMYNGQFAKGLVHLAVFAVLVSLTDNVNGVFGITVAGWVAYMVFEAYHTAKARRDGLPLPDTFGLNSIGERMGFPRPATQTGAGFGGVPVTGPAAGAAAWSAGAGYASAGGSGSAGNPYRNPAGAAAGSAADYSSGSAAGSAADYSAGSAAGGNADLQSAAGTAAGPGGGPGGGSGAGYTAAAYAAGYVPPPAANWVGYVPPTAYGPGSGAVPGAGASWSTYGGYVPYTPVETGAAAVMPELAEPAGRRYPVGALWLIGLGVLFLIAEFEPNWRLSSRWLVPILLAGLALWMFAHRMGWTGEQTSVLPAPARAVCVARGPAMLLTLAVLIGLNNAGVLTFGQSWPVLIIALGALMLAERSVKGRVGPPLPGMAGTPGYPGTAASGAAYGAGAAAGSAGLRVTPPAQGAGSTAPDAANEREGR